MGFGIPLNNWLRYQLKDWAVDIISTTDWEDNFGIKKDFITSSWNNFINFGIHRLPIFGFY